MAGNANRLVQRRQLLVNILYGVMTVVSMLWLRQTFFPGVRIAEPDGAPHGRGARDGTCARRDVAAGQRPGAQGLDHSAGIGSLGYAIQRPIEDRFLMSRSELETRLTVLLAGRAAEQLVLAEIPTGAADDLARATQIARTMVARYGMVDALGGVSYDAEPPPLPGMPAMLERATPTSDETEREIDLEVRRIIKTAERCAHELLVTRRADLDRGAALLLERETLVGAELSSFRATTGARDPAT